MKNNRKPQLLESVESASEAAMTVLLVTGMFIFFTVVMSFIVFASSWN
jgi:hypothetical protein